MSYIINKTDGTVLTEIIDGTIDQTATDLTLIGKNATSYGEFFNENLIKLLENFSSVTAPQHPISGQLWFDTIEKRLKVYDGKTFKVSGGTIVSMAQPAGIAAGDIWLDSANQQMYFNDGTGTYLAGPIYSTAQGKSGLVVQDIIDTADQTHSVVGLYAAGSLLGFYSKEEFTPRNEIAGFSGGDIYVGFTSADATSSSRLIKFRVPVEQADYLLGSDGLQKSADNFISTTSNSVSTGKLTIQNASPLELGPNQNISFSFTNTLSSLDSNLRNKDFQVRVLSTLQIAPMTALFVSAETAKVGIFNDSPQATLHIGAVGDTTANVIIEGDLTVNGTQTVINSSVMSVDDINVVLADGNTSDIAADEGGIILKGATDKSIKWFEGTGAWTSSEDFNLASGKEFRINNNPVLSLTTLGETVTSALGLNQVGALTELTVDKLYVNTNSISYVDPQGIDIIGDIVLTPLGNGTVSFSNKRITNLAVSDTPGTNDGVNVGFMRQSIRSAPIGAVLEIGLAGGAALTSNQIGLIMSDIYPPADYEDGTICRVHCRNSNNNTRIVKTYQNANGTAWAYQAGEDVASLVV